MSAVCPTCGVALEASPGGPGLCPRCMLGDVGAGSSTGAGSAKTILAGSGSGRRADESRASTPPEVAEAPAGARYGTYVCVIRVGAGAMGEVYKAWDESVGRWVALKFLKGGDAEEVERFRREAKLAGKLSHPNIASIYAVGEERGRHYIAMEFVEGQTLRAFASRDRRVQARLVRDAAGALAYAHAQGLVHRDIKPDNLMVARGGTGSAAADPRVFVMDFGLARSLATDKLTLSGQILGTPNYMSPEQADGAAVDARSDVWSLGATLYELVTGRPPFTGASVPEVLARIATEEPIRPRRIDRTVDRDLETILLKCLEKDSRRRYASAEALERDLGRWLEGDSIEARPASFLYRAGKWAKRNPAKFWVAAVVVTLTAGFLGGKPAWDASMRWRREGRLRGLLREADAQLERGEFERAWRTALSIAAEETALPPTERSHSARAFRIAARSWRVRPDGTQACAGAWPSRPGAAAPQRDPSPQADPLTIAGEYDALAFQAGYASSVPEERAAGAEALVTLAREVSLREDPLATERAWRLLLARFPGTKLAAAAHFQIASARALQGDISGAVKEARQALALGGLAAADQARAEELDRLGECLLPSRRIVVPVGRWGRGDLDGDGRSELVQVGNDGRVRVFRWQSGTLAQVTESEPVENAQKREADSLAADLDGDGRAELVTSWGQGELNLGGLVIWVLEGGRLRLLAEESMEAPPQSMTAADLDGDGRAELLVGVGYYNRRLRVYSMAAGRLDLRCDTFVSDAAIQKAAGSGPGTPLPTAPPGSVRGDPASRGASDILSLLVGEFTPDPGPEILVGLGPWSGWRLWLCRWNARTGSFEHLSVSTKRMKPHRLAAIPAAGVAFFQTRAESEVKPLKASGMAVESDILPTGLYRLADPSRLDERTDIEVLPAGHAVCETEVVRLSGRNFLLARSEDAVRQSTGIALHPLEPGSLGKIKVVFTTERLAAAADLDGDGDDEVLLAGDQVHSSRIRILGVPAEGAAPPETEGPPPAGIGDDFMELGQVDLAWCEFTARGNLVGVGRALELKGLLAEAGAAYQKVSGVSRADALLAAARCAESGRDWQSMAVLLDQASRWERLGEATRRQIEAQLRWVRRARDIAPAGHLDSLIDAPDLRCDNPFHFPRTGDDLDYIQTVGDRMLLGTPVRYTGGALRLSWEFSASRTEFGSGINFGIHGPRSMVFSLQFGGSGTDPTVSTTVTGEVEVVQAVRENAFEPDLETWYSVEIEYVPGADRAWVTVTGREKHLVEVRLDMPLPAGSYLVGTQPRRAGVDPSASGTRFRIRNLRLSGSDPELAFDSPTPQDAREWRERANGYFVKGDWTNAIKDYEAATAATPASHRAMLAETDFFHGMALRRAGRAPDAEAMLKSAFAADPGVFGIVRSYSEIGFDEADRALLRRALGE